MLYNGKLGTLPEVASLCIILYQSKLALLKYIIINVECIYSKTHAAMKKRSLFTVTSDIKNDGVLEGQMYWNRNKWLS